MEPNPEGEDKQIQDQYDLNGLAIPKDNPYKTMSREALEKSANKLLAQNKQLKQRLLFLQPQKLQRYHEPHPARTQRLFTQYKKKKFALKIAYIGVSYNGLTIQKSTDNTIEAHLFKSMRSIGVVEEREPGENYTRAGRTDTGVSAFGNVVALHLRTNEQILGEGAVQPPPKKPIDYCQLINNQLPSDIRVLTVREVPEDFNARYWCIERSYKYFFLRNHLDLEAMRHAFNESVMKKMREVMLYITSIDGMCRWLLQSSLPVTKEEVVKAAQQHTLHMQTKKAGKKLGLHKSTCIGVQEAIGNLKGKRLELFEKRNQKQIQYEERVRKANELEAKIAGLQPIKQDQHGD